MNMQFPAPNKVRLIYKRCVYELVSQGDWYAYKGQWVLFDPTHAELEAWLEHMYAVRISC